MIKYLIIVALFALLTLPPFFWHRLAYEAQADALRQRDARNAWLKKMRDACRVLGVGENATSAEIKAAHLRMMKKYHPDMGGSKDIAARINAAKDFLLG